MASERGLLLGGLYALAQEEAGRVRRASEQAASTALPKALTFPALMQDWIPAQLPSPTLPLHPRELLELQGGWLARGLRSYGLALVEELVLQVESHAVEQAGRLVATADLVDLLWADALIQDRLKQESALLQRSTEEGKRRREALVWQTATLMGLSSVEVVLRRITPGILPAKDLYADYFRSQIRTVLPDENQIGIAVGQLSAAAFAPLLDLLELGILRDPSTIHERTHD